MTHTNTKKKGTINPHTKTHIRTHKGNNTETYKD